MIKLECYENNMQIKDTCYASIVADILGKKNIPITPKKQFEANIRAVVKTVNYLK